MELLHLARNSCQCNAQRFLRLQAGVDVAHVEQVAHRLHQFGFGASRDGRQHLSKLCTEHVLQGAAERSENGDERGLASALAGGQQIV